MVKHFEMRVRSRMASTKRIFSRPRTRVYDSNYNIGEAYYKSALDSLDKKSYSSRSSSSAVQETIEPPPAPRTQRPVSVSDFESMAAKGKLEEDLDEEMLSTLRRIRSARAAAAAGPSAEENFESAFHSRRDEVKKRFSEKMLDSVGIMEVSDADAAAIRKRRLIRELEEGNQGPSGSVLQHWTALDAGVESASARALRSRARLNDLESEMEEMAERGAARERRAADLRALVTSEANNSMRFSSKKITTTTTTSY